MSDPKDGKPDDWFGEAGDSREAELARAARGHSRPVLPKRFYANAGIEETGSGFQLTLDGRTAKTPARHPLAVPTQALGERVAAEWAAQEGVIDPARMPLTRLVNSTIDGVAERREAVIDDLSAYAGTDLIAYRAADPPRLVEEQRQAWDPIVAWAREAFGVRLNLGEGIMHVAQSDETRAALRTAIERIDGPFRLAALHAMTTLTGSLLIALAVLHGRLTPEEGWSAAHVDERYQSDVWGSDFEAVERLARRKAEFEAAALIAASA